MQSLGRLTKNDRPHNTPVNLAPTKTARTHNPCCETVDAQPPNPIDWDKCTVIHVPQVPQHMLPRGCLFQPGEPRSRSLAAYLGEAALLDDSLPERRRVEAVGGGGGRQSPTLIMSGLELFFLWWEVAGSALQ